MVRLNRIYTRTGDDGTTGLGDGSRRAKHDARVEAFGAVDEANCAIGLARLETRESSDAGLAAIEALIRERIRQHWPSHDILGEEQGLVDTGSEYTWLPSAKLEQIGVKREKKDIKFVMANGEVQARTRVRGCLGRRAWSGDRGRG